MPLNLFSTRDSPPREEIVEPLVALRGARVERIVSHGQASPPGFWYDQEEDEWVALLSGRATLRLVDPTENVELVPGDHLLIAAHRKHRVEWTAPGEPTIWLAVFSPSIAPAAGLAES
jgi:cupin 2 domain-containing protein